MLKLFQQAGMALVTLASLFMSSVQAETTHSRWSVDLGYLYLKPNDSSSEISGPGLPPGNGVDITSTQGLLGSINYHQSDTISYQVFFGTPIDFDINADAAIGGLGTLATTDALFPTITVNYSFNDVIPHVKPFIGAGFNYTRFINSEPTAILEASLGGPTEIDIDDSFGIALQAGFTVEVNEHCFVKAAFLWVDIDSTGELSTAAVGTVRTVDVELDPSGGYLLVGYRF